MQKYIAFFCAVALFASLAMAKEKFHPKISKEEAQKTALASVPGGTVKEGELEHESGKWIWSFDILSGKDIHEVWVDPMTGQVTKSVIESRKHEKQEANMDNAEKAALARFPGEVVSSKVAHHKGQPVYIIHIKDARGRVKIVNVDATFHVVTK